VEFNKILKSERTKQGLSQSDLATKLHVARQTISKWETGESYPNLDVLLSISEILDIPTDVLLKGENNTVAETISKAVNKKTIYKRVAIISASIVGVCILGIAFLTFGRATQNIWIDRFNPFLPTRIGYAQIGEKHDIKENDRLVMDDAFGNGDYLKFSTGETHDGLYWAAVQHKGSYVSRAKLIKSSQLPLLMRDYSMGDDTDTSYMNYIDYKTNGPRNSWNPFN
jgi:transcriptional regulator with XRE-family HTH domain